MEVIVAAVLGHADKTEHVVGAIGVGELRVRHQAVGIGEGRRPPCRQCGAVDALPLPQRAAGHEQVVVRRKADLAVGRHAQGIAVSCPEDVVVELEVAGIGHAHRIACRLHDGVVDEGQQVAGNQHAGRSVGIHQIAARGEGPGVVVVDAQADRIAVDDVAGQVGMVDPDAVLGVAVGPVAIDRAVGVVDAPGVAIDQVAVDGDVAVAVDAPGVAGQVAIDGVARHHCAVVGVDAAVAVVEHAVAVAGVDVGVTDQRGTGGVVAEVDAGAVARRLIALHAAGAGLAELEAPVGVAARDVVGHAGDAAADVEAVAGIALRQRVAQRTDVAADDHAAGVIVLRHEVVEVAERR